MKKLAIGLGIFSVLGINTLSAQWTVAGTDMYSANSGNVGIGITSPAQKLHVVGKSRFDLSTSTGAGNGRMYLTRTSATNYECLLSFGTNGTSTYDWAMGTYATGNSTSNSDFILSGYSAGRILTVTSSNGYVGIGAMTAPIAKLHVVSPLSLFTNTGSSPTSAPTIRGNTGYSGPLTPDYTWWNNDQTGLFHSGPNIIGFSNGGTETMRIEGSGKVVIGGSGVTNLTTGAYKLYVTGGILTEQVRVAVYNSTGWADYVFDDQYKLMGLDSLRTFIRDNNHLPDVPTTAEVMQTGNDLAETDKILLEKIEELTLYILQLEERIKTMEGH